MGDEQFNPRRAALKHAGLCKDHDAAEAIACGLVYVGDQLRAANSEREITNNHLSAIVDLLEQLDRHLNDHLIEIATRIV